VKTWLRQRLLQAGYNVEGVRYTPRHLLDPDLVRPLEFDDVVCRHMFEHGPACTFVQVGAYDGLVRDPLRRFIAACGWSGVMLEPQPRPARRLRALYQGLEQIVILEAAVDTSRRRRSLYTVECDELPNWPGGMASFDREHLVRHDYVVPGIAAKIRELSVECVTFDDVLDRLPAATLDVLQIDAEGADAELIALFPFERMTPAIVHWEVKNLSRTAQEQALDRLCALGYRINRSGAEDMLAVLPAERLGAAH
jgi:FkbM family methyltransferase